MTQPRHFIVCPKRAGKHKVPVELCRECRHAGRCPAWLDFRQPSLFSGQTPAKPQRG